MEIINILKALFRFFLYILHLLLIRKRYERFVKSEFKIFHFCLSFEMNVYTPLQKLLYILVTKCLCDFLKLCSHSRLISYGDAVGHSVGAIDLP